MLPRCRKQFASALISLFTLIMLVMVPMGNIPLVYAATTVTVFPSQQYQVIQGWGTSLARMSGRRFDTRTAW